MITYKDYFSILEEIRVERKVSVEDLCENIISVRTYYRYLKDMSPINITVFTKLLDRLNLELTALTIYGIHFRAENNGTAAFIFRVHFHSHHDIIPIYQRVLNLNPKEDIDFYSLKSFILKYEYDVGIINNEEYERKLIELLEKTKNHSKMDIRLMSIYLSLLEIKPKNDYITLNEVIDIVMGIDFRINALYYYLALDRVIQLLIRKKTTTKEQYEQFLDHAKVIFDHFYFRDALMNYAFYEAFKAKINKEKENLNNKLYKHAIYSLSRYGNQQIQKVITTFKKTFDIDYQDFLIKETKNRKTLSHINLID